MALRRLQRDAMEEADDAAQRRSGDGMEGCAARRSRRTTLRDFSTVVDGVLAAETTWRDGLVHNSIGGGDGGADV
ncbi:hypothetical protein HN51_026297, partial [Arachis hypogaea]